MLFASFKVSCISKPTEMKIMPGFSAAIAFAIGLIIFVGNWSERVGALNLPRRAEVTSVRFSYVYILCWTAVILNLIAAGCFFAVRTENDIRYDQDRNVTPKPVSLKSPV